MPPLYPAPPLRHPASSWSLPSLPQSLLQVSVTGWTFWPPYRSLVFWKFMFDFKRSIQKGSVASRLCVYFCPHPFTTAAPPPADVLQAANGSHLQPPPENCPQPSRRATLPFHPPQPANGWRVRGTKGQTLPSRRGWLFAVIYAPKLPASGQS